MVLGTNNLTSGGIVVVALLALLAFLQISASGVLKTIVSIPVRLLETVVDGLGHVIEHITGTA